MMAMATKPPTPPPMAPMGRSVDGFESTFLIWVMQGLASRVLDPRPSAHRSHSASSAIFELGKSPQSGGHSITELSLQAVSSLSSEYLPSTQTAQAESASADGGAGPCRMGHTMLE